MAGRVTDGAGGLLSGWKEGDTENIGNLSRKRVEVRWQRGQRMQSPCVPA